MHACPRASGPAYLPHFLCAQVTSLGGLENTIAKKRWLDVCSPFDFPPTFTSRSYTMRRLYSQILWHFERVFFLRVGAGPVVDAPRGAAESIASELPSRPGAHRLHLCGAPSVSRSPCLDFGGVWLPCSPWLAPAAGIQLGLPVGTTLKPKTLCARVCRAQVLSPQLC